MSSTSPLSPKHLCTALSQCPSSDSSASLESKSSIFRQKIEVGVKRYAPAMLGICVVHIEASSEHYSRSGDCLIHLCEHKDTPTYWVNFHVGGLGSSTATIVFSSSQQLQAVCSVPCAPRTSLSCSVSHELPAFRRYSRLSML